MAGAGQLGRIWPACGEVAVSGACSSYHLTLLSGAHFHQAQVALLLVLCWSVCVFVGVCFGSQRSWLGFLQIAHRPFLCILQQPSPSWGRNWRRRGVDRTEATIVSEGRRRWVAGGLAPGTPNEESQPDCASILQHQLIWRLPEWRLGGGGGGCTHLEAQQLCAFLPVLIFRF